MINMKNFKEIIFILLRPLGIVGFVCGAVNLFVGDCKLAACNLFIVSIIFIIGYFAERCSK